MRKTIKGLAAVLAVTALSAGTAYAGADKLIVKGTDGTTTKFSVQDDGNIVTTGGFFYDAVNKRVGVGTTAPAATFHNAESSVIASRGVLVAQHNDGAQGANIVFRKSRGTEAAATMPIAGDYIGQFAAQFWDGTTYQRSGQFGFRNDGPVVGNLFPTKIVFMTGNTTTALKEGMAISSGQDVITGNAGTTATADLATSATNGFLYIPNVAGALTSCASVTTYTGHVPVWFDTVNSKICTCQAGALKCTAALN